MYDELILKLREDAEFLEISSKYNNTKNEFAERISQAADVIEKLSKERKKGKCNGDRIRSMTDEELSSWINDHADCTCRCEAWKDGCMDSDSTCMAAWLDWLKEEVKDDG